MKLIFRIACQAFVQAFEHELHCITNQINEKNKYNLIEIKYNIQFRFNDKNRTISLIKCKFTYNSVFISMRIQTKKNRRKKCVQKQTINLKEEKKHTQCKWSQPSYLNHRSVVFFIFIIFFSSYCLIIISFTNKEVKMDFLN